MLCRRNPFFFDSRGKMSLPGKTFSMQSKKKIKRSKESCPMRRKHSMMHLGAFQVLNSCLDCDMMRQCAHNQDELPCVARGVTIQPLWHVRFPCYGLEDAFERSATTGGLLPRCRYVLPPASHFVPIFGVKCPYWDAKFSLTPKKRDRPKKKTANRGPRLTPEGLRPQQPRRRVDNAGQHGKRAATKEVASSMYFESVPARSCKAYKELWEPNITSLLLFCQL
jgi:hypothetical protein